MIAAKGGLDQVLDGFQFAMEIRERFVSTWASQQWVVRQAINTATNVIVKERTGSIFIWIRTGLSFTEQTNGYI